MLTCRVGGIAKCYQITQPEDADNRDTGRRVSD